MIFWLSVCGNWIWNIFFKWKIAHFIFLFFCVLRKRIITLYIILKLLSTLLFDWVAHNPTKFFILYFLFSFSLIMIINFFNIVFIILNRIIIFMQINLILDILVFRIDYKLSIRILALIWLTEFLIWRRMRLRILIKTLTRIIFLKVLTIAEARTILLWERLLIALALKFSLWVLTVRLWVLVWKSLGRCFWFIHVLHFFVSNLILPLIVLSMHFWS